MNNQVHVTPIRNTFTPDFSLSKQQELGICDWQASDDHGRVAFGHSEQEARANFAALSKATA